MNKIKKLGKKFLASKYPWIIKYILIVRDYFKKPIPVRIVGSKKALVCYISAPFRITRHDEHSNQKEVVVMADVLSELDFTVDVVDYTSKYDIDYSPYDLLIGFGEAFSKSFSVSNFRGKRILHCTGANTNYSNEAEARRARNLWERRGVLVAPRREVNWSQMFSAINSDAIFVLGNSWTMSTFDGLNSRRSLIPVPYVEPIKVDPTERDYFRARYNLCWFSGSGSVHKGLDLVLEAISGLDNNFHLDVCGQIECESDFFEIYNDIIFNNPKVTFHGFVDVKSEKMKSLMLTNTFIIFPSCSEGGGSSVITCMAAGLIPIVSKEASVNIEDFGILIENTSILSIREAIILAVTMEKEEMQARSAKAAAYAMEKHSYESYASVLKKSIIKVCQ